MLTTRPSTASEFSREAAFDECRAQLSDLRAVVKSSKSNREKGAFLLNAASEAVQVVGDAYLSNLQGLDEKALFSLINRVHSTLDRAEAVVKVYGTMSGIEKLISSRTAASRYSAIIEELHMLTSQARLLSENSQLSEGTSPPLSTPQGSSMASPSTSQTTALAPPANLQIQKSDAPSAIIMPTQGYSALTSEGMPRRKLRKGSRLETVTAMALIDPRPEDPQGSSGHAWWFVTRIFGSDKLIVRDLSSGVEQRIEGWSKQGEVTCIHVASNGLVWTGHSSGAVMVWDGARRRPLCSPIRPCTCSLSALTTDENGAAWVGSVKGEVKCVKLQELGADGATLGLQLSLLGALQHTGAGTAEVSASNAIDPITGMVSNIRAKERAHDGPVASIAAAVGRVWTSGGSAAFVCLREWTQRGEFMNKQDLRNTGAATTMTLCSPIVKVTLPSEASLASSSMIFSSSEVPQAWQLLTSHGNGMIQVWGQVLGVLRPLLRVGERTSPITGLAIHEPLSVLCMAHLDGRLSLCAIPDPKGSTALTMTYVDRNIGAVKLPVGDVQVSKVGLAHVVVGAVGVLTASNYGSIMVWTEAMMRNAAQELGLEVAACKGRVLQYDSTLATTAFQQMTTASPSSGQDSRWTLQHGTATSTNEAPGASATIFPADASRWMLDFKDLTMVRKIGEGAFGKVYLGRWQETDVAIKMLTSLQPLGLPSLDNADSAGSRDHVGDALKTLEREVGIMVSMRHPNVILFMGVCPEPPCVVTEYCARGSLYDLLVSARNNQTLAKQLDWPRRIGIAMDAAKGMLYLHSHKPPIIHRDLKSPNLLVDRHWRAKVTDFNLSRITEAQTNVQSSLVASNPRWMAPEVIRHQQHSTASDVYSFGLVLWELAMWEMPFVDMTPFQIMMSVGEKGERPEVPSPTDIQGGPFEGYAEYVGLFEACWSQDPAQRPAFDQIISTLRSIAERLSRSRSGAAGAVPVPSATNGPLVQAEPKQQEQPLPTMPEAMRSPFDAAEQVEVRSPFEQQALGPSPFERLKTGLTAVDPAAVGPGGSADGQRPSSGTNFMRRLCNSLSRKSKE